MNQDKMTLALVLLALFLGAVLGVTISVQLWLRMLAQRVLREGRPNSRLSSLPNRLVWAAVSIAFCVIIVLYARYAKAPGFRLIAFAAAGITAVSAYHGYWKNRKGE